MTITVLQHRDQNTINQLTTIWENAVRNSHDFLTENDIQHFKKALPKILSDVPKLIVAFKGDQPIGFIGVSDHEIEMLFVDPLFRSQGVGKQLLNFAIQNFQANRLTVNEQNPQAVGFYQHLGFKVYHRTSTDDQGNPFPLLYMKNN